MSEQLARATISVVDRKNRSETDLESIDLDFNPETLTIKIDNATERKGRRSRQRVQYTGSSFATLSFDAIFDSTRPHALPDLPPTAPSSARPGPEQLDVRRRTRLLSGLLGDRDGAGSGGDQMAYPKLVRFQWGSVNFLGYVESYSETLDYFSPTGVPLRAKVSVSLTEQSRRYRITGDDRRRAASGPASNGAAGPPAAGPNTPTGGGLAPPGGDSGINIDDALAQIGATLEDAAAVAAQSDLSALTDIGAGLSLEFDPDLALGIDVGVGIGVDLGIGLDLGVSAGAGISLDVGDSLDVFGGGALTAALGVDADLGSGGESVVDTRGRAAPARTATSAVPSSSWAPDGPSPGSRASELAGVVARARFAGAQRGTAPAGAGSFSATALTDGGGGGAVPILGSPPRVVAEYGPGLPGAVYDKSRRIPAVPPGTQRGRPRWEQLPREDGVETTTPAPCECGPCRSKSW